MAKLRYIMLHCTATPEGMDVTPDDIRRWHTTPKEQGGRGWKQIGYSYLIQLDGTVIEMVPNDGDQYVDSFEITNGAKGFNNVTLHIVYAGGVSKTRPKGLKWHPPKDTRTQAQLEAMEKLVKELLAKHPKTLLIGHNQVSNKACPSFDVPTWAESINIGKARVFR